jgi:hypothetical protein
MSTELLEPESHLADRKSISIHAELGVVSLFHIA